jgi:hypothetical protein
MAGMWKRVHGKSSEWRVVYKGLSLLDYLLRNGAPPPSAGDAIVTTF